MDEFEKPVGKLEQQIRYVLMKDGMYCIFERMREFFKEAKKEFPLYCNYTLKKEGQERFIIDLEKWFVKWFGDEDGNL